MRIITGPRREVGDLDAEDMIAATGKGAGTLTFARQIDSSATAEQTARKGQHAGRDESRTFRCVASARLAP